MKREDKTDLRIIKTKTAIYNSLIALMETKSFEDIRVSEICEKAMVNRSTFYSHFTDKYALLDSIMKELKSKLDVYLEKDNYTAHNLRQYAIDMLNNLISLLEVNKKLYYGIMTHNRSSVMMDMLLNTLKQDFLDKIELFNYPNGDIPKDVVASYYIGAISNTLQEWLKGTNPYTKDEMLYYFDKLLPKVQL